MSTDRKQLAKKEYAVLFSSHLNTPEGECRTTLNEIPLTTQTVALLMTLECFDDTQSNSALKEVPVFSRQHPLGSIPAHLKRSRIASRGGFMSAGAPGLRSAGEECSREGCMKAFGECDMLSFIIDPRLSTINNSVYPFLYLSPECWIICFISAWVISLSLSPSPPLSKWSLCMSVSYNPHLLLSSFSVKSVSKGKRTTALCPSVLCF